MNQIYFVLQQTLLFSAKKQAGRFTVPPSPGYSKITSTFTAFVAVMLFSCVGAFAQTTYYSNASATDFNSLASWGTATDGTGTAPAAISNADNFIVANGAALTLSGNAAVRQLTINTGSLTVAANTLTVSKAGSFDSVFDVNTGGTLNLSGTGLVDVRGNVLFTNGSSFVQTGGTLSVDGNSGGSQTGSVASGTPLFAVGTSATSYTVGTMNWTGGKIVIVDPHAATTNTHAISIRLGAVSSVNVNINAGTGHTLQMGDGISTDAGGNSNGFYNDFWIVTGALKAGNYVINTLGGVNRHVVQNYRVLIGGDLTVTSGEYRITTTTGTSQVAGNIYVAAAGILTNASSALVLANGDYTTGTTFSTTPVTIPQTVGGPGAYRNSTTSTTASFYALTINNTSAGGVTFTGNSSIAAQPANSLSVANTLTFTAGKAFTAPGSAVVVGTSATSTGTLSITSGGFGSGATYGRWVGATSGLATIAAGANSTSTDGRFVFVNANGESRVALIKRTGATSAGGVLAATYVNTAGTSAVSLSEDAYTADVAGNDTWAFSQLSGNPITNTTSFDIQLQAPGIFGGALASASARVAQGSAFVGTHLAGTVLPAGNRTGLTAAQLTAAPFRLVAVAADAPVTSVASGDWNSPATWSTGAVPVCTKNVAIMPGHTVTVNSTFNEAKNITVNALGVLIIASGDLTVECSLSNGSIVNSGTLTVTGGTLNVNGYISNTATSSFAQLGGTIYIDGNNGVIAESVASGTPLFSSTSTNINLSAGTLIFVDPHIATTNTSGYTIFFNNATPAVTSLVASPTHITQFGDGSSTTSGGHTSGFYINNWEGSAYLSLGSVIINGETGTNRNVATVYQLTVNGNLTVNQNSRLVAANLILSGNLTVDGTLVNGTSFVTGVVTSNTGSLLTLAASPLAQTINFSGTIANAATSPTGNFTAFTVNNSSAAGLTINQPVTVTGILTLTAGKVHMGSNMLTHTSTSATGLVGGSATSYIDGALARNIANANAATNYILFPVGKTAYAPISLAPATTSASQIKAEAFDTNGGTMSSAIVDLATNRRWETSIISGGASTVNVRVGDANLVDGNVPVMAPSAAGQYTSSFGSTATFTAGTPPTVQGAVPVTGANFTGFLSYAKSGGCSGSPAPGNTIASVNGICAGTSVTFSVQNETTGAGVTYQWQTSVNGTDNWTDISTATNATYTTVPTASLYYRLNVTCATGPATTASTPVQITFTNSVTANVPATRCGAGAISLSATPSAGASIVWYTAATGNTTAGTGNTLNIPSLATTTTYYAAAESESAPMSGGAKPSTTAVTSTSGTGLDYGMVFNATSAFKLNSVDIYIKATTVGSLNIVLQSSTGTVLKSATIATPAGNATTPVQYTVALGWDIPVGTGYRLLALAAPDLVRDFSGATVTYPYAIGSVGSVTGGYAFAGTSGNYYFFYNWNYTTICSSVRVPVTATVNTPPALTLSSPTASICSGATSSAVTVTSTVADYDNYVWTPSTGVSGNATTGWTFNPAATTTYTLNASQTAGALCANSTTVVVTVNETPSALTVTDITTDVCAGSITALTAAGGNAAATLTLGTGTTLSGDWDMPTAFNNRFSGYGMQTVYTATELQALGMRAGNINSIAFNVATLGSSATNANYTVKIATTSLSSLTSTSFLTPAFTTVFGPATYTHTATGWQTITFTAPYNWDGTSNLLIQISMSGANSANNTQTYYTPTTDNTVLSANNSGLTTGTLSKNRLNIRFNANAEGQVTWSPAANLYTDAAATVAYVGGAAARTVYAKFAAAGNASFTATATNPEGGCTATATETFNVADCSIGWGNLQWPANGDINTCGTHTVYGRVWKAGVTEPDGAGAGMKAWIGVSTTNTDPATWTEAQWSNAPFNTGVNENDLGDNDEYKGDITGLAAGTYYYAFRYQHQTGPYLYGGYSSGGGGPWGSGNVSGVLTVNAVALPTAADQAICSGKIVDDLVATGAGLKWYTVATNGTALASTDVVTAGTYYVSQTVGGCESARVQVAVTISTFTAPEAIVTQPTCTTSTGTITVTSLGAGYTYSIDGSAFDTALVFTSVAPGPYTVTAKNSLGCTMTTSVTVNAAPTVPATPMLTPTQPTCSVATGTIVVTSPTGLEYSINGGPYQSSATFAGLTAGDYTVTAKNAGGCTAASVSVTINPAPTAPVVSPVADVAACGSYALPVLTVGNYFTAANGGGTALDAGTSITSSQTIYIYAVSGTCSDEESFMVTINQSPVLGTISNVTACDSYTLPVRTVGRYYTQTGGLGTELLAGAVISTNQTIYVYAESAATPNCTAEQSFTVTLTTTPAQPSGAATQTINVAAAADATIEDLVATAATGTISWYATEANALSGTSPLAAGTQLENGTVYYASAAVGTCYSTTALAVTVSVVLGRDDFSFTNLKYYPNPVADRLTISHSSAITSVEVYNLLGQLVISERPNAATAEVNMGQLQQATYIVRISAEGKSKDFKVVKK